MKYITTLCIMVGYVSCVTASQTYNQKQYQTKIDQAIEQTEIDMDQWDCDTLGQLMDQYRVWQLSDMMDDVLAHHYSIECNINK